MGFISLSLFFIHDFTGWTYQASQVTHRLHQCHGKAKKCRYLRSESTAKAIQQPFLWFILNEWGSEPIKESKWTAEVQDSEVVGAYKKVPCSIKWKQGGKITVGMD